MNRQTFIESILADDIKTWIKFDKKKLFNVLVDYKLSQLENLSDEALKIIVAKKVKDNSIIKELKTK